MGTPLRTGLVERPVGDSAAPQSGADGSGGRPAPRTA